MRWLDSFSNGVNLVIWRISVPKERAKAEMEKPLEGYRRNRAGVMTGWMERKQWR